MTNTYKPTPEKVAEWIKDHQYTQLANTDTVEVWRAQKPGSSAYAFDITMSRYGIAVYGDIGSLVFNVGRSYGLKFLAGTDEDYVYRKLDESSRETDLDEAYLVDIVHNAIIELLGERDLVLPEWKQAPVPMAERVEELRSWLLQASCPDGEYGALCVALKDCQDLEIKTVDSAYQWLSEHQELLELADDLDYTLSKPTNSVMQRIYLVRHAAQMILAQQQEVAQKAAEVEYAYARNVKSEAWTDDSLAAYLSDMEAPVGAVIGRAIIERPSASHFVPDADAVIEAMADDAQGSDYSEWVDDFPSASPEALKELTKLLEPVKSWADRHCPVSFFTVSGAEPYTVTAEDIAAAQAYRAEEDARVAVGF